MSNRAPEMADIFVDKKKTFELFQAVKARQVEEECEDTDEFGEHFRPLVEMVIEMMGSRNLETVFEYSESPIEKIFLNSIVFGFLRNGALDLLVGGPVQDFEAYKESVRGECSGFVKWIAEYIEHTGDKSLRNLEEHMKQMFEDGRMPEAAYVTGLEMLGGRLVYFFNAFHLMLQPTMRVGSKKIRPDIAICVPADDTVRIIVECDGFKFHGGQATFESDRVRDRALAAKNYKVMRFSGAEICKDPLKAGKELVQYLLEFPLKKMPSLVEQARQNTTQTN